VCLNGLGKS